MEIIARYKEKWRIRVFVFHNVKLGQAEDRMKQAEVPNPASKKNDMYTVTIYIYVTKSHRPRIRVQRSIKIFCLSIQQQIVV